MRSTSRLRTMYILDYHSDVHKQKLNINLFEQIAFLYLSICYQVFARGKRAPRRGESGRAKATPPKGSRTAQCVAFGLHPSSPLKVPMLENTVSQKLRHRAPSVPPVVPTLKHPV